MKFQKALVLSLSISLASCLSTNPATGAKNFSLVGEKQEFELGKRVAQEALKDEGQYTADPALTAYYHDIAERLVKVSERSDKPFEFLMLDSPTFNAWAVPGYINMYRGIMPYFNSEAEFVSVLAHEMGHVTARHSAQQVTKGTLAQLLVTGIAIYAGTQIDNSAIANAAYVAGAFGASVALKSYSRDHEKEADRLALRYMSRLGYDSRESYRMFQTMGRYRNLVEAEYGYFNDGKKLPKAPFYSLLLSHPEPASRMAQVAELVGKPDGSVKLPEGVTPATPSNDPQGQRRFYKMIDGLPFGPQIKHGIAGNGVLYHPEMRFKWQLPTGYTFNEVKEKDGEEIISTWRAYNANQKTWAFQRKAALVSRGNGQAMLREEFSNISNIQAVKIDDKTGYMGQVKVLSKYKNWPAGTYRVLAVPAPEKAVGSEGHDFIILAFGAENETTFNTHDSEFKRTLANTQLLTAGQARNLKSLHIKIHTVGAGDTVTSLSNRMAIGALQEEWFRTLNGLDKTDTLRIGQQVKLVNDPNR